MCGIVGKYFFKRDTFNSSDLQAMIKAIEHRGPDDKGEYCDGRIALGFTRLSIIDTESGHQPLFNERDTIVLIANGEIYNFRELREELKARGHSFRTKSDCEVIIHLYEEYGDQFIARLNGMFAFCLYDSEKEKAIIARDRIGIKPLYYYLDSNVLIFGSEIKGLIASELVPCEKRKNVLDEYLCFRSLSNQRTFFAGIDILEPGSCIIVRGNDIKFRKFWESKITDEGVGEKVIITKIDEALDQCVKRQMVSDVPLGSLLSGGVDSSWVSAVAGRYSENMNTFTVGFQESEYDETNYARMLADTFGLVYHDIRVGNKEFADFLPKAIWYHDEPLTHANSVQIYLICKYAKEYVKVLLTGEGADELFGGYPRYYICKLGHYFLKLGSYAKKTAIHALNYIPERRIQKLTSFLGQGDQELVFMNAEFAKWSKISKVLDHDQPDLSNRLQLLEKTWKTNMDLMDNLLIFEQKSYLQAILARQDKMSMGASIESRVPILDNQMLSLANSIPARKKINYLQPKHLFKKGATRNIPRDIVYKKKVGFGVPIGLWLRDTSGMGRYLDLLLDQAEDIEGINKRKLEDMVMEHKSGKENHEDVLWPLVNYALWHQIFFN
jgi:asparagine synthase (glutamine-hydrolysing)